MEDNIANATFYCNSNCSIDWDLALAKVTQMQDMAEINQTRHQNLLKLIDSFDNQNSLAYALGFSPGYINQLVNKRRPITEKTARKIEKKLSLTTGCLDKNYQSELSINESRPTYIQKEHKLPKEHDKLINLYDAASPKVKMAIMVLLEREAEHMEAGLPKLETKPTPKGKTSGNRQ
jgi:plasmid maintenance system antidote protein VapI